MGRAARNGNGSPRLISSRRWAPLDRLERVASSCGRGRLCVLSDFLVDQRLARQLPDESLGQRLVAKFDQFRHLDRRQLVLQELSQLVRRQAGPGAELDPNLERLAA